MDRETRDKFVASTDQDDLLYGESACLETPPDFFEALNRGFDFQVDLTANEQNHLCPIWFGPGGRYANALIAPWYRCVSVADEKVEPNRSSGYSNPPYGSFIPEILRKAVEEAARGFTSAFLLPMRASSWYTEIVLVHATHLWHLEPRLTFWYKGEPKPTAKVKWTKKWAMEEHPAQERLYVRGEDGCVYHAATPNLSRRPVLVPANALFDSIVVVFRPQMAGLPHIPYTVCPKVWRWKEQPVTDLL